MTETSPKSFIAPEKLVSTSSPIVPPRRSTELIEVLRYMHVQTENDSTMACRNRAGVGSASVAWSAGRMACPPNPNKITPNAVPNVEKVMVGVSVYGS